MTTTTACDVETRLIEAGRLDPDLVCVSFCDDSSFEPTLQKHDDALERLRQMFEQHTVVGANFAYDAAVLLRRFPELTEVIFEAYRQGRVLDVQLAQMLIDLAYGELHQHSYSLSALHERYGFGALEKDEWRLRYGEFIDVPLEQWPEGARKYARDDAAATLRVWRAQQVYAEFLVDLAAQTRAALALHLQSVVGMVTDAKTCREYIAEVREDIAKAKKMLLDSGLVRPDGSRNTKLAKERMLQACTEADVEPKLTKTGQVSLDAEACRDAVDPLLRAYATYTSANTILTKAELLEEGSRGVPLQTSYVVINRNGRTSSREPSAPLRGSNFQNVPRKGKLRQCFVPRPGYYFVSIDYSMDELHCVSQVELWFRGQSKLAEALNNNRDVHCDVASMLLGKSYDEVFANKKTGAYAKARQQSKEVNFGGWGVMSAKRLMAQMNKKADVGDERVDLSRAMQITNAWKARWEPEHYFNHVRSLFPNGDGQGLTTIKQFVTGRVRSMVDFPAAANGFFSGLATDAIKASLFELTRLCRLARLVDDLYGTRAVLYVHDEVIAEVPVDRAHEAAYALTKVMVDTHNLFTPDVPVRAEPALMTAWHKDAEPNFDVSGKLIPWSPN